MLGMRITRCAVLASAVLSFPAWCQENPYTYVKMSLLVPWTLYFVFLACVLIPFVLVILLAWQSKPGRRRENESSSSTMSRTDVDAVGQ